MQGAPKLSALNFNRRVQQEAAHDDVVHDEERVLLRKAYRTFSIPNLTLTGLSA